LVEAERYERACDPICNVMKEESIDNISHLSPCLPP
jgi:hypothetical protein